MAPKYETVQQMSDEEIIEAYNNGSENTVVGIQFWLDEIIRRRNERTVLKMEAIASKTLLATWIAAGMAIAALIISIITLLGNGSCR